MPPECKPRKAYQRLKGYTKVALILFRGNDSVGRTLLSAAFEVDVEGAVLAMEGWSS
jgi:hypothetical protein